MATLPINVFDVIYREVPQPNPGSANPTVIIPVGGAWQPNDWRFVCTMGNLWSSLQYYNGSNYLSMPLPSGWTALLTYSDVSNHYPAIIGRRLVTGDTDAAYGLQVPAGAFLGAGLPNFSAWGTAGAKAGILAFTVRGIDPTFTPVVTAPSASGAFGGYPFTQTIASRTLTGSTPCYELLLLGADGYPFGTPSGWTDVWDSGFCGDEVTQLSASTLMILAKAFASGSSTGTTAISTPSGVAPAGGLTLGKDYGLTGLQAPYASILLRRSQDISPAAGAMPAETDTLGSATFSLGTSIQPPAGAMPPEVDTFGAAFSPLTAVLVTDPEPMDGYPVIDSVTRWTETITPGHSSVTVETSVDGAQTWQAATNGGPIPNLPERDTAVDTIRARITGVRDSTSTPIPRIGNFEMWAYTDAGVNELIPVGTFMIKEGDVVAGIDATGTGSGGATGGVVGVGGGPKGGGRAVTVKAVDYSRAIDEAGWNRPYYVPAGTLYSDAGIAMVKDRFPTQTKFRVADTSMVTPLLLYGVDATTKPFKDISELYMAIGWWNYFSADGTFVAKPVVDPALVPPCWEFREDVQITDIRRNLTDQDFLNHVIVEGEATSPLTGQPIVAVHAEAIDLDPITGINGKAGRRSRKFILPAVQTQAQAQAAADALLLRYKGCPELVYITVPPVPTLEPGDVVAITAPGVKAVGNYAIRASDIPGGASKGMRLTVARQTYSGLAVAA